MGKRFRTSAIRLWIYFRARGHKALARYPVCNGAGNSMAKKPGRTAATRTLTKTWHLRYGCALTLAWLAMSGTAVCALTIQASFDPSLTSQVNAAEIEAAINRATSLIGNLYSDSGTVKILFQYGPGDFLGESFTGTYTRSYSTYVGLLQADIGRIGTR